MAALGRVRLSPWLVVLLAAGWLLEDGFPVRMAVGLACVVLHEMGHVVCAVQHGCTVEQVELTPFGGAARVAGLEQLRASERVGVALCGPAVSLLLMLVCGCGAYLLPQGIAVWAEGLQCNAVLLLFNLLPAYPMDGGRVLCALLERRSGMVGAQRCTAVLGMALGGGMAALGVLSCAVIGKINLTLLLCGGYLCAEAWKAHREAPRVYLSLLTGREKALRKRGIIPVRTLAVRKDTPEARICAKLRPGALYRIVYLDEELRVCAEKWETELWK